MLIGGVGLLSGSVAQNADPVWRTDESVETPWGFAQILEHIDVAILLLDLKQQKVDYQNPAFSEVIQDDRISGDFQALYGLLLEGQEEPGRFGAGGHFSHQVSLRGRLLGYSVYRTAAWHRCVFIRDITEKVRFESIAQAVNAMDNIGFIFSGIRHEIGNPLNSLKMALSVLRQNLETFSPAAISAYVDRSLADIGRMEYLLKSLKTFSMFEHVDLKDLSLAEIMRKFLSLVERDFSSYGIRIVTETPLDIARIRVDDRALHQALLNIFNNAVDALRGRQDPEIRIRAELRGRLVWLRIADNGCGISPEQQKYLFQPFSTSKPDGNGLGLVISRKLLAMMNSDIDIESRPKQGTEVTISLPVACELPDPDNRQATTSAKQAGEE